MDAMQMTGGAMPSMPWVPACGESWIGAAASFLGMWTVMMAVMMLPSLVPALWRYGRSAGRAGVASPALPTALAAAGYLSIWILLGVMVFPLGAAIVAVTVRHATLARLAPIAAGLVVLTAGALQFTRWKAHHLARCRDCCLRESIGCGRESPRNAFDAWRYGLRLGIHCGQCCAGLTAAMLVTGIMDVPAMAAVTAGITLERLAPGGAGVARFVGLVAIGAGLFLTVRAAGLS